MSAILSEAKEGFQEGVELYVDTWRQLFRLISGVLNLSKDDIKIRDKR